VIQLRIRRPPDLLYPQVGDRPRSNYDGRATTCEHPSDCTRGTFAPGAAGAHFTLVSFDLPHVAGERTRWLPAGVAASGAAAPASQAAAPGANTPVDRAGPSAAV
jgi:hypothetical protein